MCASIRLNGVQVIALLASLGVVAGCVASRDKRISRLVVADDTRDYNLQLANESDPKRLQEARSIAEPEGDKDAPKRRIVGSRKAMKSECFILPGVPHPSRKTAPGGAACKDNSEPLGCVQAIYDGKYALAVTCADRLIASDPGNAQALEILGSAYFLLTEKQKAKEAWQRALKLEPQNSFVAEYIDELE